MAKINFITPLDVMVRFIESDENLTNICQTILNVLNSIEKQKLGLLSIKNIKMDKPLNDQDESLLKYVFACHGWKFLVHSRYNENGEYYMNVIISMLESK